MRKWLYEHTLKIIVEGVGRAIDKDGLIGQDGDGETHFRDIRAQSPAQWPFADLFREESHVNLRSDDDDIHGDTKHIIPFYQSQE